LRRQANATLVIAASFCDTRQQFQRREVVATMKSLSFDVSRGLITVTVQGEGEAPLTIRLEMEEAEQLRAGIEEALSAAWNQLENDLGRQLKRRADTKWPPTGTTGP
jgi:hypothetical protein